MLPGRFGVGAAALPVSDVVRAERIGSFTPSCSREVNMCSFFLRLSKALKEAANVRRNVFFDLFIKKIAKVQNDLLLRS